ncbi:uncharacterized protein LOC131936092 [Physella acuta]|uniref:uncharacterized protein LOC131936092 n=1 Tax=Physella acuta TaxID=109671 RepID=UPI0027DC0C5C|nr:uncharacterized protein LOC131936092 [Physella acuta]
MSAYVAGCKSSRKSSPKLVALAECINRDEFISGFYRNERTGLDDDPLQLFDKADCSPRNRTRCKTQTVYADWWSTFDKGDSWANCPDGYFLNGLYRSDINKGLLNNIEEGRCSKQADHPSYYGHCYDHDISVCFDNKGLCRCNNDYYVTGIYRGDCDKLYCLDKLRCCKTVSAPEELDEASKVKTRIMDTTMSDMALLAHYLGYGWCSGCRAPYVGEDFRRTGDAWHADKSGRCEGYMSDKRLSMAYGDWRFEINHIKYGTPVLQDLIPETIEIVTLENNESFKATKTYSRIIPKVRSVTHTTTSSWKHSDELNGQISYTPPSTVNSTPVVYTFKYENSTVTSDQNNKENFGILTHSTSKDLNPHSAVKLHYIVHKTRTTTTYTATVMAKFSTELQGFLRWGNGPNSIESNYHNTYRGSKDRPTFNYKFGDSRTPFYEDLKNKNDAMLSPWLWELMKHAYPDAKSLIDDLCNKNRYVFHLTGRFDDVIRKSYEVTVKPVN